MERLHYPKAVVGKTLLGMLRMIHQQHPDPAALVHDFDLHRIVLALARNESQVLVSELAGQLLQDFDRGGQGQGQAGDSGGGGGDSQKDGSDPTNDQPPAAAGAKLGTVATPVVQGSGGLEGRGGGGGGGGATPADASAGEDARQGSVGGAVSVSMKPNPVSPSAAPRPAPRQAQPLPPLPPPLANTVTAAGEVDETSRPEKGASEGAE